MDIGFDSARIVLGRRQELELTDAAGMRITCHEGSLWITQEHDTRDIMLAPGEGFVLDRPGLAILRAMRPSTLLLALAWHTRARGYEVEAEAEQAVA